MPVYACFNNDVINYTVNIDKLYAGAERMMPEVRFFGVKEYFFEAVMRERL